jgi:hypothetical protein
VELGRIAGRLVATVLGLIGVVLALLINAFYSGFHDLFKIAGAKNIESTHGFIGLALIIVAFVGALLALFRPRASALLLVIGGAGFFYPVGLLALIASPFMLIGALLAFIDKAPAPAKK